MNVLFLFTTTVYIRLKTLNWTEISFAQVYENSEPAAAAAAYGWNESQYSQCKQKLFVSVLKLWLLDSNVNDWQSSINSLFPKSTDSSPILILSFYSFCVLWYLFACIDGSVQSENGKMSNYRFVCIKLHGNNAIQQTDCVESIQSNAKKRWIHILLCSLFFYSFRFRRKMCRNIFDRIINNNEKCKRLDVMKAERFDWKYSIFLLLFFGSFIFCLFFVSL